MGLGDPGGVAVTAVVATVVVAVAVVVAITVDAATTATITICHCVSMYVLNRRNAHSISKNYSILLRCPVVLVFEYITTPNKGTWCDMRFRSFASYCPEVGLPPLFRVLVCEEPSVPSNELNTGHKIHVSHPRRHQELKSIQGASG